MRSVSLYFLLASSSLVLAGCEFDDWSDDRRVREDFQKTVAARAGGRVEVEGFNGSVEITGWDRDSVEVTGTKQARNEADLKSIEIDVTSSGDTVRVRAIRPLERRGNMGVSFVVRVPRRSNLERIATSNGSVKVEGIEGVARLRTSNGGVRVSGLKGNLELATSNGGVEVRDQQGGAILKTSNGGVRAEGIRGDLDAHTSNGSIHVRLLEPEPQKTIRLGSSNGSIELTMESHRGNDIRVSTTNASITVRLPGATNARLVAGTSNGSVQSDFDLLVKGGKMSKNYMEGTIGSGGSLIDLSTSNGPIRVLKL